MEISKDLPERQQHQRAEKLSERVQLAARPGFLPPQLSSPLI